MNSGPQRVVHVDFLVPFPHFGQVSGKIGRARGDTDVEIEGIEPRFEKAVQKSRGEHAAKRPALDD